MGRRTDQPAQGWQRVHRVRDDRADPASGRYGFALSGDQGRRTEKKRMSAELDRHREHLEEGGREPDRTAERTGSRAGDGVRGAASAGIVLLINRRIVDAIAGWMRCSAMPRRAARTDQRASGTSMTPPTRPRGVKSMGAWRAASPTSAKCAWFVPMAKRPGAVSRAGRSMPPIYRKASSSFSRTLPPSAPPPRPCGSPTSSSRRSSNRRARASCCW